MPEVKARKAPSESKPSVVWIDSAARHPLCDIPWVGFSVILSNGDVNFCCNTPAVAGNVNQQPFEQIWQGPMMQRIRRELSEQRLPPECRTTSCPINRGDSTNFIVDRVSGAEAVQTANRASNDQVEDSFIRLKKHKFLVGDPLDLAIGLRCRGKPFWADLFVAIRQPSGACRFLPGYDDYAVPFQADVVLEEKTPVDLDIRARLGTAGTYQVCAALFASQSNPNVLANCYWSQVETVTVG